MATALAKSPVSARGNLRGQIIHALFHGRGQGKAGVRSLRVEVILRLRARQRQRGRRLVGLRQRRKGIGVARFHVAGKKHFADGIVVDGVLQIHGEIRQAMGGKERARAAARLISTSALREAKAVSPPGTASDSKISERVPRRVKS